MARQCPFVKSVTRGMFKQSDITLKEAITGNGIVSLTFCLYG